MTADAVGPVYRAGVSGVPGLDPVVSDTDSNSVVWRCEECGKWSHAKRRPQHHQRFVPVQEMPWDRPPEDCKEGDYLGNCRITGIHWNQDGVWVRCGPFAKWEARKVE